MILVVAPVVMCGLQVYYDMYEKDKERYATELRTYQQTGSVPNSAPSKKKQPSTQLSQSAASTGARDSPASVASSVPSSAMPASPPLIQEPAAGNESPPLPANLFEDSIGSSGALADVVDASSPLMECTPPDVLAAAVDSSASAPDVPFSRLHADTAMEEQERHMSVDGLSMDESHSHHVHQRHNSLVMESPGDHPLSTLDDDLEDGDDLCNVYALDDGGSSAGLDPHEAASIARSFANDDGSNEDEDGLHMNFPQPMLDN